MRAGSTARERRASGARAPGPIDEARAVLAALERDECIAAATRVDGAEAGARLLLDARGTRGGLGDGVLDEVVRVALRAALDDDAFDADTAAFRLEDGASVRVLLQVHRPAPHLVIVGAGHISVPLARIAGLAGFRVTVLDDREEFADAARFGAETRVLRMDLDDPFAVVQPGAGAYVVLVTRAHRHDYDCLRRLLRADPMPRYIGMIGSRRRVRAAFGALLEDGVPRKQVARVRAPLGLSIGAQTPDEIAVSVVAEMIAERRGVLGAADTGAPLSTLEDVVGRFFSGDA